MNRTRPALATLLAGCLGIVSLSVGLSAGAADGDATAATPDAAAGAGVGLAEAPPIDGRIGGEGGRQEAGDPLQSIVDGLAVNLPGLIPSSVAETPVAGLYEVVVDGQIYYVNDKADYLLDGSLIELDTRTNLTEGRLGGIQTSLIEEIGEENMLIYEPDEPSERSITVFTDISCGFCRRLHEDIDVLLDAGVRVRYLLFPRAGVGSPGHQALESVWCADDPLAAMTTAKAGGQVPEKSCANPIESHVALAERIGLRGTPLIYTDSGERIPGFREADALAAMVNHSQPLKR